ncbi:DAO domain-containing protein [Meloidogyne graminicola]|uniref:DAO domain-containing protein n=1 Tax=Meloidogyne graminicola TaxID=189291 RepID=A0A8S9ZI27_9BILA|nr:DAO domain-containing protein [Meloidogyne graminicola]
MEIRYLTAPKLNNNNLGNKLIGYRPCRHGPPRIEVEKKFFNGKMVIIGHNYGHSGSGWTLSKAIVNYLNNLIIEAIEEDREDNKFISILKEKLKVNILGAGVIGLFTAYDLLKKGFKNLNVIAEQFDDLTSHIAGGLLAQFALDIDNNDEQKLIDQFCIETYSFYKEIAQGKNVDFPERCAKIIPAYVDNIFTKNLEQYVASGVMKPAKQVFVQFDISPNKQRKMFVFDDAILVQPYEIMNKLYKILKESGNVKFIKRKIETFEDINEANLIINCTGIGAKKLCFDEKMYSIQGHLINLKEQKEEDLNYMIIFNGEKGITECGKIVERAFYMFPKRSNFEEGNIGVIGGTFVKGIFY